MNKAKLDNKWVMFDVLYLFEQQKSNFFGLIGCFFARKINIENIAISLRQDGINEKVAKNRILSTW